MANVVLRQLAKTYPGGVQAVRDVNLEIADGEFVVLVGPSGSGKTTILRMIAGLEDISAGEIQISGQRVNDVAPAGRDVAMVFQNHALYPHLSVRQNLTFGLTVRRTPKVEIERRIHEAARMLAIEHLLDRRPRELSGGERQRVALGRAIVRKPKMFLFDEPLSNLDAALRVQMRAELARLHQRLKTTILYVTHDQAEAMTLGQRIVVMDRGIVRQIDTPLNLYRRPTNRFVGAFIGSPAMNFLAGEISGGDFRLTGGGTIRLDCALAAGAIPPGPATLGVRPEDLLTAGVGLPLASVTLDVVEHLGHEAMGHFDLAGNRCVARLACDTAAQPGDQLTLAIRPTALHLFAGDSAGRRLN